MMVCYTFDQLLYLARNVNSADGLFILLSIVCLQKEKL